MRSFSPDLIQRIQRYFADKYGDILTSSEAEEYLDSFADFYLAIAGVDSDQPSGGPKGPAGLSDSSDLISPHNCNLEE